ncbi:23S rRNA (guanosine(2251)-2'-O)-methyltransferase RlmB [Vagococcus vulneris]|uniref:23S rRNA (Guanosine(2251)-2'-O)-methyltransferase RlmB n=1 Tax=Vagococcus vulneris TaxID=1977869 RepID=A0A430A0K5_9ENTE|nr:23S rRNA (guanosine(2251)-2'-O)-methyltransferase RlmB [Vagococcus vulneris]RST99856.1 23S rRNA (guanosine(2251)-2'-O)-methyltransferase RlmB [Vagococcus vulneris]
MTHNKKEIKRQIKERPNCKKRRSVASQEENADLDDVVFGRHAVTEALNAKRGNKLFLQEDLKSDRAEELKTLAASHAVAIKWVKKVKLDDMTNKENHQGIVLKITPYEYLELDELLAKTVNKNNRLFLILDSIMDPHNLGSIMRTADATGVDGIIIPKHRAVGITPVVVKTSTGAVEHVPVARVTNLVQTVKKMKKQNIWVFGTDMKGTDYRQWNVSGDIALVIGNEGKGMSQALTKEVDEMVTIPIVGHVQSLNASVAASLLMYEVLRKRI